MLRLALLRHAKSSWDDPALDDFDRPLNERGRHAAPLMGRLLQASKFVPDIVLCSSARRTRETLDYVMPYLAKPPQTLEFVNELYLASADDILACVHGIAAPGTRMLIVGHNPGMQAFASQLAISGDAAKVARLRDKFPTGALAIYSFPQTTFSALDPKTGYLDAYMTPKDCS